MKGKKLTGWIFGACGFLFVLAVLWPFPMIVHTQTITMNAYMNNNTDFTMNVSTLLKPLIIATIFLFMMGIGIGFKLMLMATEEVMEERI